MIPEFGQFALALALCMSAAIAWFGLAGAATGRDHWVQALGSMVTGQFVFVSLAFLALTQAFLADDFSVAYVANNSNSLLP
jgi:cytochrome c-type biogenesis protein CcmF